MYPDNNMPNTCGDACGTMPECAPLAVPYVPFQQTNPKRYSQQDALNNGTLFPGLNLPFRVKPDAAKVMGGALAELQALEFVLVELGLYLDTHQGDAEAFGKRGTGEIRGHERTGHTDGHGQREDMGCLAE